MRSENEGIRADEQSLSAEALQAFRAPVLVVYGSVASANVRRFGGRAFAQESANKSLEGLSPSRLARPPKSSKLGTHSLGQNLPARG
jgi:hypothetical protein